MTRRFRRAIGCWLLAQTFAFAPKLRAQPADAERIRLFADRDDDDDNGVADGAQPYLAGAAADGVRWFSARELGRDTPRASPISSPLVRFVADARAPSSAGGLPVHVKKLGLQGLAPGRTEISIGARTFDVSVVELAAFDAHGSEVDLATSHASISRVLPAFLTNDEAGASDEDALRWMAIGEEDSLPTQLAVVSLGADGQKLDALASVELWELPCPPSVASGLSCRATPLLRATADRIDRGHPESSARSLRAEVGGRLSVFVANQKAASIRVGGPRTSAVGPIERWRARVAVHVLRATPGGPPAIGADDTSALALVRNEVTTASLLWGQCGIHFGMPRDIRVEMADPPPAYLVAIGCGTALPASGGELRMRVQGRSVRVPTASGELPVTVAMRLAAALRGFGLGAQVSENPHIESSVLGSADVLVRAGSAWANVERDADAPLSSDASLSVCIGSVDLNDGLSHFTDHDAIAGTLEERTLVKAFSNHDPSIIEVFVVPAFSGVGRVGESFLDARGAAIHNTVIVDRAAILAGARSHVLAHEIGHILLDMPGHPDDYGVDQPTALMDSDATDPSIFGPRRLAVEECERALRERGPSADAPLLAPWPLFTRAR